MQNSPTSEVLLAWTALDHYPHERSARWYSVGGLFVLGFAAYGLFEGSWSTALVALGIGLIYFLLRNVPPRLIRVSLNGLGITVDGTFTAFGHLRTFWITETKEATELHLLPLRSLQPEIMVFLRSPPLPPTLAPPEGDIGIDPAIVREVLLRMLPERTGMEERVLDTFARTLKL